MIFILLNYIKHILWTVFPRTWKKIMTHLSKAESSHRKRRHFRLQALLQYCHGFSYNKTQGDVSSLEYIILKSFWTFLNPTSLDYGLLSRSESNTVINIKNLCFRSTTSCVIRHGTDVFAKILKYSWLHWLWSPLPTENPSTDCLYSIVTPKNTCCFTRE